MEATVVFFLSYLESVWEMPFRRECVAARQGVAVMDASTLGKIDIQGPDAAIFLDRIYTNFFSTLPQGQCRYGLMCKADGMVFDDGVTSRLGNNHFLMTTTTGGAARVLAWLEEWLQTEWPDLEGLLHFGYVRAYFDDRAGGTEKQAALAGTGYRY